MQKGEFVYYIQGFNDQWSFWMDHGEYNGGTGAKDLLCDLVAGKASFQVNLTGSVGNQAWNGHSWTGPLVAN